MHTIHCRFKLDSTLRRRAYDCVDDTPGNRQYVAVDAAEVVLNAVQGEPFGKDTPSGQMKMTILNQTLVPHLLHEVPIYTEYDVVFFPRVEGKSHPIVANLTGEERDPNP